MKKNVSQKGLRDKLKMSQRIPREGMLKSVERLSVVDKRLALTAIEIVMSDEFNAVNVGDLIKMMTDEGRKTMFKDTPTPARDLIRNSYRVSIGELYKGLVTQAGRCAEVMHKLSVKMQEDIIKNGVKVLMPGEVVTMDFQDLNADLTRQVFESGRAKSRVRSTGEQEGYVNSRGDGIY